MAIQGHVMMIMAGDVTHVGTSLATLTLGQAAGLLDDVELDWDSDQLFDAIRALEVPVENMT